MAFIKILPEGDYLVFDLDKKVSGANQITIELVRKAGKVSVLEINADKSIPITQFRKINGEVVRVSPKP